MNPVSVPPAAVAPPIAPPVSIPTEFVPLTQYNAPPASIPPPTMQNGGVAGSMMSFSPANANAIKGAAKSELPLQFTTPSGEISWISLMLLGLFIVGTSYQIILAHQQITKHKDDDEKIAELQKRVTTLEALKRAA